MKTVYYKTFRRVVRNGRVKRGPFSYCFPPGLDISWLEGVSIKIEIRGPEMGCFWCDTLYYCPTSAERELIGADKHTFFIPLT
jgi:hypothetical protein